MNSATSSASFGKGLGVFFLLALLLAPALRAADVAENAAKRVPAERKSADEVIADYLINFLFYVDWPETVPPVGEPWRIGLVKSDEVARLLKKKTAGKSVRARSILIVEANDPVALQDCQMVLLSAASANGESLAKAFADRPVLTVVFHEKVPVPNRAMIDLVLQGRSIRYRLNAAQLTAHGLKPTPGLLENSLPPIAPPLALAQNR